MERGRSAGIDLFLEDGAYTTLTSAVSILVILSLLFAIASGIWSMSRAGDTQVAADVTALAGANVVSSYHTAATVLDASVLSMGLAGLCVTGAGLVGLLIPGVNAVAPQTINAGLRMLEARNKLATSASKGLKALESSLPLVIAANGTRACAAQGSDEVVFTGSALAVPLSSGSDFPALEGEQVSTEGIESAAGELDEAAQELAAAAEETAKAKEEAWLADCGSEGRNMQERAGKLSALSGTENPDYASSITWEPEVALNRTRSYYAWRLEHDEPESASVEAAADSAARKAFYRYAVDHFRSAHVVESGGRVTSTAELLPRNTDEVRKTTLYTESVWPTTREGSGFVLHYGETCPGAEGAAGPLRSLADVETGAVRECPVCHFGIGDVGRVPAASTSIDNGYEYHLRAFTEALDAYVSCRNRELELERAAQGAAETAGDAFDEALSVLSTKRPRIAPPGRYGVVSLVVSGELSSPDGLDSTFAESPSLSRRGALSAAVLAPDAATNTNNVLSSFFSSLEHRTGGGGAVGLIDDVMGLWGSLLVSYGDVSAGLSALMDDLIGGLSAVGMGSIASWLSDRIDSAVRGLGFEPVDLSSLKPVLTDSGNVLSHADVPALANAQELLRSIPLGTTDPSALLQALQYEVGEEVLSASFTIAEIPLPGGESIPLTIRLSDVVGPAEGKP